MSYRTKTLRQTALPAREHAFPVRLCAAGLATLVALSPIAPSRARAWEPDDEPAPVRTETSVELSDEAREAILEGDRADDLAPAVDSDAIAPDAPANDTAPEDVTPISLPGAEARTAVSPQAISLPDAEGSVEGMGESFAPILSSGTATFSVPIAVAPGRHGVQPSLGLSYSSSSGNGPVGFGWNVGAPFISRQVDRGLPRYVDRDGWHAEEDRFLYNGGQELVPVDDDAIGAIDQSAVIGDDADATARPADLAGWQQYRSRVEGAFMRFFRSTNSRRWVVQSRDGTRFDFGMLESGVPGGIAGSAAASVERDPESSAAAPRIYRWLLTRMSDAHGSTVYYTYTSHGNQSYLSDIHYISPASCAGASPTATRDCTAGLDQYGARVHLDYDTARPDVFSSYASGWRMDTAWRLRRIEVSAWNDVLGARAIVRRYHLAYDASSFDSLLASVQVEGRQETWNATLGVSTGIASTPEGSLGARIVGRTLPPMRFGYSTMPTAGEQIAGFGGVDVSVHAVVHSPPHSVDEARADLFDVNSDGLPDLIVTDPARYRTSSGAPAVGVFFNGFDGRNAVPAGETAHFSNAIAMPMDPSMSTVMSLGNANVVPMDIDGDGRSDLLHMPRIRSYGWFTPTRAADEDVPAVAAGDQGWRWSYGAVQLPADDFDPRIDLGRDSSHLEIVDVNNDHLIDVVRTTGTVMQTWLNLGWLPDGDGRFGSASWNGTEWVLSTAPIESCLLQSGTPIDFENPELRLAEINGDGLLDIVEMRSGRIRYWPGRGPGSWGEGTRSCARGEGAGRYIEMTTPPVDLAVDLDGVSFMDVNADGASDIVQIRFDAVDVWFNRAGRGWSPRLSARGTPATPSFLPRTRFADIDGSGTTDIVWANAGAWQFVDLAGGHVPRLLTRVENGLGAQTDLAYESSARDYVEDLADAQRDRSDSADRFTWGRASGAASRQFGSTGTYRSEGSPVISTVVRSVTTSAIVRPDDQPSETRFAYHDGYYEGIEQEFRGFGAADAQSVGDWNNPTSFTRTFFHQGRRPQAIADDRLADNPYEALKGREYLTEAFDESGVYLSSAHATITTRAVLEGQDGRWIRYAFVSEANELRYDTTVWGVGTDELPLSDVVHERFDDGDWVADAAMAATTRVARVRGMNFARIRTTYPSVDSLGQVLEQTAHGHVELGGTTADEPITSVSDPILIDGASWLWRTASSYLHGSSPAPLRASTNAYNATGDLGRTTLEVSASRSYAFDGDPSGEGGAIDPDAITPQHEDIVSSSRYDAWGNAIASCVGDDISEAVTGITTLPGGCLRYGYVAYDSVFAQLALTETAFVTGGAAPSTLGTIGTWDRGLGAVLTATDPNTLITSVTYDGLGRLVAAVPPNVEGCSGTHPTTRIAYELSAPMSRVVTTTELDCNGMLGEPGGTLVSMAYVDGLGRVRAGLSTGDSSGQWIRGGITTLDKKGSVRRSYQPDFFTLDPSNFAAVAALPVGPDDNEGCPAFGPSDIPYTIARHDAFGRVVGTHAEDCSYTTTSYHTLSTDVCDPLDNDPSSLFHDTCTTARTDGHGRVIDQILRLEPRTAMSGERHRLWSYYRADGVVLDLVRAQSHDEDVRPTLASVASATYPHVHRVFHYDTQGRRIGSDDPDTDDPDQSDASRATWRYLFNRAGDIAAVRDPRGCGQNFFYDLGGRLLAEQYVGCGEGYSAADVRPVEDIAAGSVGMDFTTGTPLKVDVRYFYDDDPTWITVEDHGGGLAGRATGVSDRGQRSGVGYDARGNAVWTARQMAVISDAPALTGSNGARPSWTETAPTGADVQYDEDHTYERTARFDHAGRGVALVLPEDFTWGPTGGSGTAPRIGGELVFGNRGLPTSARATIGCDPVIAQDCTGGDLHPIVASIEYTRDGLPFHTEWGDANGSHPSSDSTTHYDVRRRPDEMVTTRAPTGMSGLAAVSEVVNQHLHWDEASNLIAIEDLRPGDEWDDGHRPQTVSVTHDPLYRVTGASFSYTEDDGSSSTSDTATDWRDTQAAIVTAHVDPMEVEPAGMIPSLPAERVQELDWSWDWLGNSTEWTEGDEDPTSFYERSIGRIQNGNTAEASGLRPSALYFSTDIPTGGLSELPSGSSPGFVEVDYGVGGNVTAMTVHGRCTDVSPTIACADPGASSAPTARADYLRTHCTCTSEQHYQYRWDELNRLGEARRWDRSSATSWSWQLEVRQRYAYDGANVRTIKQTSEPTGETDDVGSGEHGERIALYVYAGDYEVRGLERGLVGYAARTGMDEHVETQFVVGMARIAWRHETDALASHRRITVALTDLIQTSTATLDLLTGEIPEASNYYPNGARESLLIDSDDPSAVEQLGFTGKEEDAEVGVVYFGERYLISHLGRWASPDPLQIHSSGASQPLNSYHYISGNVLRARDLLGLDDDDVPPTLRWLARFEHSVVDAVTSIPAAVARAYRRADQLQREIGEAADRADPAETEPVRHALAQALRPVAATLQFLDDLVVQPIPQFTDDLSEAIRGDPEALGRVVVVVVVGEVVRAVLPEAAPVRSAFPSLGRTAEAAAAAQTVVEGMTEAPVSAQGNGAVTVITHADHSVSVGLSGSAEQVAGATARLQRALDARAPGRFAVSAESIPTEGADMAMAPCPGRCSEWRAARAAESNPSPATGYETVWRARGRNPHPLEGGVNGQMQPCDTCAGEAPRLDEAATRQQ